MILDLAFPRNIDPELHAGQVEVYNLEDLAKVFASKPASPNPAARHAEELVFAEAESFSRWLLASRQSSALSRVYRWAESTRREETDAALRRLPSLSGEGEEGRRGDEQEVGEQAPRAPDQLRKVIEPRASARPAPRRSPTNIRPGGKVVVDVLSVRIGARSSRLSQAQTAIVSDLMKTRFGDGLALQFIAVKTLGDRLPPAAKRNLGPAGAKGAFTGDIEALLLDGKIDIAIHSMKDLTSDQTEGPGHRRDSPEERPEGRARHGQRRDHQDSSQRTPGWERAV